MIKTAIVGYGNLGKGVLKALKNAHDMSIEGIFTRRNPKSIVCDDDVSVYNVSDLKKFKDKIDVLILCGGSATDLPQTTAEYLKDFCTVDSFDTHAKIPAYYDTLNKIATENNTVNAISIGWDPGIFSIARAIFGAVLPDGKDYTFWGKGVSQGHSDAVRRIKGVKNAIQYTIPKQTALDSVRKGEQAELTAREKHLRECFVVPDDDADKEYIENAIKTMPDYFADYDTVVHFITEEELKEKHSKLSHGGFVMRSGSTSKENKDFLELNLKLDSNPEFTGSVLVAYARAVYRLKKEGKSGTFTVFDIPLTYLSDMTAEEMRKKLL